MIGQDDCYNRSFEDTLIDRSMLFKFVNSLIGRSKVAQLVDSLIGRSQLLKFVDRLTGSLNNWIKVAQVCG